LKNSTSIRIGATSQKINRLPPKSGLKQLTGCLLVFAAAAFYYLSTVVIRRADHQVFIAPAFFVFVRFSMGFAIVCASMLIKGRKLKPKRYDLLIGRAVANGIAVYCFYTAVTQTTLAQANILNMTYPVFVALLSWIFLKKQRDVTTTIGAVAAFAGIYLILAQKGPMQFGWLHLWGLASGISASFAMIFLNLSRQHHDTETILFFLFGIGSILTYAGFSHAIHMPSFIELYFLVLSSGFAIIGQYCITFGYRYVTAVEGGIISSSRILLAATLGPFIASDPYMDLRGWLGAGLIFGVNAALAWRKSARPLAQSESSAESAPRHPFGAHQPVHINCTRRRLLKKACRRRFKMKSIRQASRRDLNQINALRIREFQRSAQFKLLKPEKLKWNQCDDVSIVLSAWDGATAVATMRAVVVCDTAEAENCVQCNVPKYTPFPAMVFNNAATHLDYRGIGLNQLLRYHFLKIALDAGIQCLLSPMYEGAPRIQFMKDLGYGFTIPPLSWQNKLAPKATRILGLLTCERMSHAIKLIEAQRRDIITSYPWKGKRVQLNNPMFKRAVQ
jgi:drug/metabolite transporter (DMT)-like permease